MSEALCFFRRNFIVAEFVGDQGLILGKLVYPFIPDQVDPAVAYILDEITIPGDKEKRKGGADLAANLLAEI